jgi:hypothetical protein
LKNGSRGGRSGGAEDAPPQKEDEVGSGFVEKMELPAAALSVRSGSRLCDSRHIREKKKKS